MQKQATSYKKAIDLLINLRDLATRNNSKDFPERLRTLREKNKRKYSFEQSIDDAALVKQTTARPSVVSLLRLFLCAF